MKLDSQMKLDSKKKQNQLFESNVDGAIGKTTRKGTKTGLEQQVH